MCESLFQTRLEGLRICSLSVAGGRIFKQSNNAAQFSTDVFDSVHSSPKTFQSDPSTMISAFEMNGLLVGRDGTSRNMPICAG